MSTFQQIKTNLPNVRVLPGGFDYRMGGDGAQGSLRLSCPGSDLQALIDRIAGKPATILSIGGTTAARMIPLQFPRDPTIYADDVRVWAPDETPCTPGPDGSWWGIDFKFYFVDILFVTPKWSLSGAYPMVTRDRDSMAEMRTWPGTAYQYPSDGLRLNHAVGVATLQTAIGLSFEGLTSINDDLYDSLIGCVNSTTFLGKPPGTVLYEGCSSSGQYTIGGVPAFRARQQFRYSRIPHRMLMRPDGSGYEAPTWVGNTSKYLFDQADLNQLYA